MGFDYPLGDTEPSGRGEATSSYGYKPSYSTGCSSDYIPGSLLSFSGVNETEALAKVITTKNIVNTSRDMISGLKNMYRESNL